MTNKQTIDIELEQLEQLIENTEKNLAILRNHSPVYESVFQRTIDALLTRFDIVYSYVAPRIAEDNYAHRKASGHAGEVGRKVYAQTIAWNDEGASDTERLANLAKAAENFYVLAENIESLKQQKLKTAYDEKFTERSESLARAKALETEALSGSIGRYKTWKNRRKARTLTANANALEKESIHLEAEARYSASRVRAYHDGSQKAASLYSSLVENQQ